MKLIITEEQLRLIIESEQEGKLLTIPIELLKIDNGITKTLNLYYDNKENKGWDGIRIIGDLNFDIIEINNDDITKLANELVEVDGYLNNYRYLSIKFPKLKKVNGYFNLSESNITELPKLKRVEDNLYLTLSEINSLPELEYVGGILNLYKTNIESLPMLEEVGDDISLLATPIESFPRLKYVGGDLNLKSTPLSKTTTGKELRKQINVGGKINI